MRKLSPAYVVTSVVIALAGSAYAQTAARPAIGNPNLGANAPRVAGSGPSNTPNTEGGATNSTVTNASANNTVNNGNAASNKPVLSNTSNGADGSRSGNNTDSSAANRPIGSTSANGNQSTNSSANANGSRSGNNTNGSAANSPIGSSGASSANGANTGTQGGLSASGSAALAPGVVSPFINGTAGSVTNDGERPMDNSSSVQGNNGNANVELQNNGNAGSAIAVDQARNSQNLDRAIRLVEKDRKRVGKNGQLLNTIAPRTNADRSHEMPDDGPSPALTGTSSALTRR